METPKIRDPPEFENAPNRFMNGVMGIFVIIKNLLRANLSLKDLSWHFDKSLASFFNLKFWG